MIDRRTRNAEIFRDTEQRYKTDQTLLQAVRQSTEAQRFIAENVNVSIPAPHKEGKAKVVVSGRRSLQAAESYAKQGKQVCVLKRPSNAMNPCAGNVAAKITKAELEKLLTSRVRRIFEIAVANGNEVLILGAFGCGAFRNPPEIVAKVFNKVMQEFLGYFDVIEYAVYHTERKKGNYEAFKRFIVDSVSGGEQ